MSVKKIGLIIFALTTLGCRANQDIVGNALKKYSPPVSSGCSIQKAQQNFLSPFQLTGKKALFDSTHLNKGKKIVAVVDEACRNKGVWPANRSPQRSVRMTLTKNMSLSELETEAQKDPCLVGLSESADFELFGQPNDPEIGNQKHLTNIEAFPSWDFFFKRGPYSNKVVLGVIDTGVTSTHDELKNLIWHNPSEILGNSVDDDHNGYVDDDFGFNFANHTPDAGANTSDPFGGGHGTAVAGVAMAETNNRKGVAGVMPQSGLVMSLAVFGQGGAMDTVTIDEAIRYGADNGAKVINMSLGAYKRSESTAAAMVYALSKGVVIVAAAGNSDKNLDDGTSFVTPASYAKQYPGIISVGAIDAVSSQKCNFSNFGTSTVKIGAPACSGLYAIQAPNGTGAFGGTSGASPQVAAAAALVYGFIWDRTGQAPSPSAVEKWLMDYARKVTDLKFVNNGTLDLLPLAIALDAQFPVTDPQTPPPPNCP